MFFTTDLAKKIKKNVHIDFLRVASYDGEKSGDIKLVASLLPSVIENITGTWKTLKYLTSYLKKSGPKSIKTCPLLDKP